jgi:esterase/lipase superfamily enzyme
MIKALLAFSLLFHAADVFGQPIVKTQAPGSSPTVTITAAGTIKDFDADSMASVQVGVSTIQYPPQWMPAGRVSRDGSFRFRTELTEGDYWVVAVLGQFLIGSEPVEVKLSRTHRQSLRVTLTPATSADYRAGSAGLYFDRPRELEEASLLPNQVPFPPPAPPPPPPGPGWASDKNRVRVFYATNRRVHGANTESGPQASKVSFLNEPGVLRFGYYDVGVTFVRATSRTPLSTDSYKFATYEIYFYRNAAGFKSALSDEIGKQPTKEVLLLVHGYNTPFEDGINRTAQFAVETGFHGVPVYFGWPGGEHWWQYPAASKQVSVAAVELAAVLKEIAATPGVTRLHVVAHSLGNSVLVEAIDRLTQDPANRAQTLGNLVMAAPDVIPARFLQVAGSLAAIFQQRTVYVSDTDWALRVGSSFDGQQRIGRRTPMMIKSGFEAVDATGAKDTIIGHSYFVDSDTIANDIAALVVRGLSTVQRGLQRTVDNGSVVWRLPQSSPE